MINKGEAQTRRGMWDQGASIHILGNAGALEGRLNVSIGRITSSLFKAIFLLVASSLLLYVFDERFPHLPAVGWLHHAFDLNEEANLPTFFSTGLLLMSGCLSLLIARAGHFSGVPASQTGAWRLLGWILVAMAGDELLMFHETLNGFLEGIVSVRGIYMWLVPGALAVVWFIFFFLRFFRGLPGVVRRHLILSLVLFVSGALGLEVFEGLNLTFAADPGTGTLLLSNSQEALEMLGEAILLKGLLIYIRDFLDYPRTQLSLLFGD